MANRFALNIPPKLTQPVFRVTTYEVAAGEFTGTTLDLTLEQALEPHYFVQIYPSADETAAAAPSDFAARVTADPFASGDLSSSSGSAVLQLTRATSSQDWVGVVTVVECLRDYDASGFRLHHVLDGNTPKLSGSGTQTIAFTIGAGIPSQTVPMHGIGGGGMSTAAAATDDWSTVAADIKISGSDIQIIRETGVAGTIEDADWTAYLVEWGSEWTIQSVEVTGNAGGAGLDSTTHYNTAALSTAVLRSRSWLFSGWRSDEFRPDGWHVLTTLGDGVNQLTTETSVASGRWAGPIGSHTATAYVMTHPGLRTDWRFQDRQSTINRYIQAVDEAVDVEAYRLDTSLTLRMSQGRRAMVPQWGTSTNTQGNQSESMIWVQPAALEEAYVTRADDNPGTQVSWWIQSVDWGGIRLTTETDEDCGPTQWLIFPDVELDGSTLLSATTETGFRVGPVTPATSNGGRVFAFHSGDPTAEIDHEYRIGRHGDLGRATWIFRESLDEGESFGGYYGWNGWDFIWGSHNVNGIVGNRYGMAAVYSRTFDRTVVATHATVSTEDLQVMTQNLDGDPYAWTDRDPLTVSGSLVGTDALTRMVELDDGTILLVALVEGDVSTRFDWDVYRSIDGGESWTLIAEQIFINAEGNTTSISSGEQPQTLEVAASGDWVRIIWTQQSGPDVQTMISSTRGGSWSLLSGASIPVGSTGYATDPTPIALEGIPNGNGGFLMWVRDSASARDARGYSASRDDDWISESDLDVGLAVGTSILGLSAALSAEFMVLSILQDRAGDNTRGWSLELFDVDDPTNTDLQISLGDPAIGTQGSLFMTPTHLQLLAQGRELAMVWSNLTNAGGAVSGGVLMGRLGGWSQLSVENITHTDAWEIPSVHYAAAWGNTPEAAPTSRMPYFSTGTPTVNHTLARLEVTTNASTEEAVWEVSDAGAGNTFKDNGMACGAIVRVLQHVTPVSGRNVGLKVTSKSVGATGAEFMLNATTTMVLLWDVASGTEEAFISTPAITEAFYEVRMGLKDTNSVTIAARRYSEQTWTERGRGWETQTVSIANSAGITMDSVLWGNLDQSSAGVNEARWKEFWCTPPDLSPSPLLQTSRPVGDLRGRPTASRPARIHSGVDVYWGGSGGNKADTFSGSVALAHGKDQIFVDSPRYYWEAAGTTQQAIVVEYPAGCRTHHEAVALFGTRARTATVEYARSNDWGSPVTSYDLSADIFTARVGRVDGRRLEIVGIDGRQDYNLAQLAGRAYLRITAGAVSDPVGTTWEIQKAGNGAWVTLSNAADTTNDLSTYNISAGDTAVVFADQMAVRYGEEASTRYMRVVFPSQEIAEGAHALSNLIAGPVLDFDPPLDWAWKDNQQPNSTEYRTRSAVRWAFKEGPAQRTLQARLIGDYTQRFRDQYRAISNGFAEYDVRALAFVLDGGNMPESMLLGFLTTGGQLDNEGWFPDAADISRATGDLSIQFVESV